MALLKPQNIGAIVSNFIATPEDIQQFEKAKLKRLLNEYLSSLPVYLNNSSKLSIIERIMETIEDGDFFAAINSNYNTANLLNTPFMSYNNYLCAEPKLYLFAFKKRGAAYNLYLGLDNEDLIVKNVSIKKYRTTTNASVANYALGDCNKLRFAKYPSENRLENSVECDRFDPINLGEYTDHHNDDKMGFITNNEELALYKLYYKDVAKCPHFHVFPVKLMATKPYSNSKSLAIELADLRRYVSDLDQVTDTNSPLLKYDLSMPYLMIKTNQVQINIEDFLSQTQKLLDKYSKTNNKDAAIMEIYNLLYAAKEEHKSVGAVKQTSLKDVYNALTIIEASTEYLPIKDQLRLVNSYNDCIYYSNVTENTNYFNPEENNR